MKGVYFRGCGAVSPAGWGAAALVEAALQGAALPTKELKRPGVEKPLRVRTVPPTLPRPAFLAHARLRRSSPIAHHALGAALEALGEDLPAVREGKTRLGVIVCVMSGCVNYSRRFYQETLNDPSTASPLVFPETVFNAPASHLSAFIGSRSINYTLIGDEGAFLQGLALAGDWLLEERVDGCLVVGCEEIDWLTADALHRFSKRAVFSEGAGAVYLKAGEGPGVRLELVTSPRTFAGARTRGQALAEVRSEIPTPGGGELLLDSAESGSILGRAEAAVWQDWAGERLSIKNVFGEGLMAGSAWQTVAAARLLESPSRRAAVVSVAGLNQQAIAARFVNEP